MSNDSHSKITTNLTKNQTILPLSSSTLNILPSYVWLMPDLKWLYISNGFDEIPTFVYQRLIDELPITHNIEYDIKRGYHDITTKKEWIIINMIYIIELNSKNANLYIKKFGKNANISTIDFMVKENNWKNDFNGTDTFDIIICNPPLNNNKNKNNNKNNKNNKVNRENSIKHNAVSNYNYNTLPQDTTVTSQDIQLYLNYFEKSLTMTKKLLFIIPPEWKSNTKEIEKLREKIQETKNLNFYQLLFK
jgi:hypothetical protein